MEGFAITAPPITDDDASAIAADNDGTMEFEQFNSFMSSHIAVKIEDALMDKFGDDPTHCLYLSKPIVSVEFTEVSQTGQTQYLYQCPN